MNSYVSDSITARRISITLFLCLFVIGLKILVDVRPFNIRFRVEDYNIVGSSANEKNENVHSNLMPRRSSSASTNSVTRPRIDNGSSIDPVTELNFFREVMEEISRKEFNYSIFLNGVENRNGPQKRKWLVRNYIIVYYV